MSNPGHIPKDLPGLRQALDQHDYLADLALSTALFCALSLRQPLLLEGEPGVGKTEAAKALAAAIGSPLLRLQCYEGIDSSEALYEWDYPRQLLAIRLAEGSGRHLSDGDLFTEQYLIQRPLFQALRHQGDSPTVLLIDEIDRADDEFEAFLLELLGEKTLTIPELGTFSTKNPPVVILTSNRTRDVHDALRRRCLYHWIDYPPLEVAISILRRKVPGATQQLVETTAGALGAMRSAKLHKPPGIAEGIDWLESLRLLGFSKLDNQALGATIGAVAKYREDQEAILSMDLLHDAS